MFIYLTSLYYWSNQQIYLFVMKSAGFGNSEDGSMPLRALYKAIIHRSDWKKRMIVLEYISERHRGIHVFHLFNVALFGGLHLYLPSAFLGRLFLLFSIYSIQLLYSSQKQLTKKVRHPDLMAQDSPVEKKGRQGSGKTVLWHLIRMSTFSIGSFPTEGMNKKPFNNKK